MKKRYSSCLFIFPVTCLFAIPLAGQPAEHSLQFDKSIELRSGESGDEFRTSAPPSLSDNKKLFRELESYSSSDPENEFNQLFSISEFLRSHLLFAQNILRNAIENEPNSSAKRSGALLLSSLELLSSPSLKSDEVIEAGKELKSISPVSFMYEPIMDGEYHFWLAEVLRSEHDVNGAISQYTIAYENNVNGGFREFVRFRRAELYEHELQYRRASDEFDTLASLPGQVLQLYSSLRRASLLRLMGKYDELLTEVSRASAIVSDGSHIATSRVAGDIRYHSLFESLRPEPYRKSKKIFSQMDSAYEETPRATIMPASPFVEVEILLLKGSAFSGMNRFDSADYYFEIGEKSLAAKNDSAHLAPEFHYLAHALKFEQAWVKLSEGVNDDAARMFFTLANEDTSSHLNPLFSGGMIGNTGSFYHDEKTPSLDATFAAPNIALDTARFIYDDYPARARFYAGIALSRAGKKEEARNVLTNLSQDPTALYADKAWYHLALVEFKSDHKLQAEGLLTPIAMRRSQSGVYASILLGDIHYRRSSFAKAAEYFGFALANLPDNDTALRRFASLERGLSLLPLGSWIESAEDLKLYVSLATDKTTGLDEALFWLGRAYFRSDSIMQARNCFKQVLDEFPNSSRIIDAQYGYAWTLFRNGEYRLADKEFAKVIEMDSITRYAYDALSRRGDAFYAGGNLKKAVAIYNLAVDRPTFNDYRTTRSLYQLGVIRMLSDSARSAMNAFHTITAKYPKSDILDRTYYDYAVAAFAIEHNDKAKEAIQILTTKFKASPFVPKGIFLAASEDERTGKLREACSGYKKILNDYPYSEEFVPSLFGAMDALTRQKKYDEATSLADSFFIKLPNPTYAPKLLFRKGEIELLASNPKNAKQTFEDFSDRFPNDTLLPMVRYMLGKALSFSSKEKAYDLYAEVTGKYTHSNAAPYAYLAMARIQRSERVNKEKAAEFYTKAFDFEYFSSEAAPQAMFEYAGFVRNDLGKADSALRIYDELTDRYLIETTIGGKSQLEAAEILLSHSKRSDAVTKLEKLATAQEGYELAAESRLGLGQLYKREGVLKKALVEFDRAREDNTTTKDQLARSYIGSAECHIAAGDKKMARAILAELLVTKGIAKSRRDAARELLDSIMPKKKKKRK